MHLDKYNNNLFWLMGPTSSGKTTLAKLLYGRLLRDKNIAFHFDGDEVRDAFGDNLGFSKNLPLSTNT